MKDLDKITEFLLATLQETKGFVIEQAPDVVRQVLAAGLIDHVTGAVVSLLFILAGIWFLRGLIKKAAQEKYDSAGYEILMFIPGLALIIGTCAFFCDASEIAKIYFTPKAYLIEMVRDKK